MPSKTSLRILTALGALVFVYFVMYPEDAKAITAPVAAVLELSQSPSPWLYMLVAVGIVTWGIVRVWGWRETRR
jgi:hypothetical protein